uniref:Uncharacterized protein n=1 Tax=Rhizophagus irregularis (strain DAOM 181602 / DAOM 197198 / MUCL 43194) TaxID=747089 RepID=U9TYN0_RHIID
MKRMDKSNSSIIPHYGLSKLLKIGLIFRIYGHIIDLQRLGVLQYVANYSILD